MPNIIKDRAIVADDWTLVRIGEGQTIDLALPEGKLIVPLPVWQKRRNDLLTRGNLGVWLSDTDEPELLANDLHHFQLVAIDFPKFANGRGYSTAALLRTRYGYQGELRAVGEVLRDQLFYMARVGFDAFAVRNDRSLEDALLALNDFSITYQSSTDQTQPLFNRVARNSAY